MTHCKGSLQYQHHGKAQSVFFLEMKADVLILRDAGARLPNLCQCFVMAPGVKFPIHSDQNRN